MFFYELLIALLVALALTAVFVSGTGWRRPGADAAGVGAAALFFFLMLFFATWAGGLWLAPIGPSVGEVYWLGFVVVGLFVALLLAAVATPAPTADVDGPAGAAMGLGLFFWAVIVFLGLAIGLTYLL